MLWAGFAPVADATKANTQSSTINSEHGDKIE